MLNSKPFLCNFRGLRYLGNKMWFGKNVTMTIFTISYFKMRQHLNKCKIQRQTHRQTHRHLAFYDLLWLFMTWYDYLWQWLMYDYLWLRFSNSLNFFTWFKWSQNLYDFQQTLTLFTFVYLCLPLLKWHIYAQILCLFHFKIWGISKVN